MKNLLVRRHPSLNDLSSERQQKAIHAALCEHFCVPFETHISVQVISSERKGALHWVHIRARLAESTFDLCVIIANKRGQILIGRDFTNRPN